MNISVNWIKKYVDLPKDLSARDFGLKLTLATVEVEDFESLTEKFEKIVVGKILKIKKHPNADKLRLAQVAIAKDEQVPIVCGGSNLNEGMLVAVALVGAKVRWHGQGEPVVLAPAEIRGVKSQGMICAAQEVGLQEIFPRQNETEILDLSQFKAAPGDLLAKVLGLDDIIYEIDNKSLTNRPDLWGHYGMAREVAAIYNKKIKEYKTAKIKEAKEVKLTVDNQEPDLCPRYLGIRIDNVKVEPSPEWLKKHLQSINVKSINNIVDITNYLLFDLGQPMHAFDASLIKDNKIIVRRANKKEQIKTLDEEIRQLTADDLVIADTQRAVALAGVMGGENSEITDKTTSIIIESATFDAYNIRKTSERLGLRTEASMRYEKSLDPELAKTAIEKAVELVLQICPQAKVVSNLADEYSKKESEIVIDTSYQFIIDRIGQKIEQNKIKDILARLGFKIKDKSGRLKIIVPSWRATKDISIAEDIVEEVARLYGYDNLEPQMPQVETNLMPENKLRNLERKVKNLLVNACAATEVYNYSFVDEKLLNLLELNPKENIEVQNPISQEQTLLKKFLLPNLLKNTADNLRFYKKINIFESCRVFISQPGEDLIKPKQNNYLPSQPLMLAGIYSSEKNLQPFYQAKAIVCLLLEKLGIKYLESSAKQILAFAHPHRNWSAEIKDKEFIFAGEIHPKILQALGIEQKVAFWQINLTELNNFYELQYEYQPIAKFPAVELDLSIVVDDKVIWKDIKNIVTSIEPQLIRQVKLFDVFKNDKIGVGKKSLAFHLVYQADDRTLELKEVQKLQDKVIDQLQKALAAKIRK